MKRVDAENMIEGLQSDRDAVYAQVIELDASEITPMVATPGDPGNGKYIRDLHTPVPIEIAYGGTCTAGKNEDMDMYAAVLADALKQGKRVASSVEFWIQFGSQETREYSKRKGYLEIFERAGARVIRAQLWAMHQCRARCFKSSGPSGDQRAEPKLSGSQRAWANVFGKPTHCGCECGGGSHRRVRAERDSRVG